MIAHANPTTDGLFAALRRSTNRPVMAWSRPPVPLAGGFWAEMYDIELADAPCDLDGRLVARIMPDPATAAFETAVQRHLTRCQFPVPAIRCAGGPSLDLDRAWSLMDFATGQPLLAGLSATTAIRQAPTLLRRLPDLLAEAAAALHQCPVDGLDSELAGQVKHTSTISSDALPHKLPPSGGTTWSEPPNTSPPPHPARGSSATATCTRSTCSSTASGGR